MIVGAVNDDVVFANDNQGSAYVFAKVAGVWVQQAKITSSDGTSGDKFGESVAIFGSTVVVGAPTVEFQGAAYVFNRAGVTWTQQVRLGAAALAGADRFGDSVAIDNDTIVIGAPDHDLPPSGGEHGAAFCFTRTGGAWSEQARPIAQFPGGNDGFGYSVSISGDLVVAGARSVTTLARIPTKGLRTPFYEQGLPGRNWPSSWLRMAQLPISSATRSLWPAISS